MDYRLTKSASVENLCIENNFDFELAVEFYSSNEMKGLDNSKNETIRNFPLNCLQEISNVCTQNLTNTWRAEVISQQKVPCNLKPAHVTQVPYWKKRKET